MTRGLAVALLLIATSAGAQITRYENAPSPQPVITVTASASATVVNDRMHATLRAEVEHADAAQAAREVNTRIARALAKAKAVPGVNASTAGYASYQVGEKDRLRWRVSQGLALEGTDFAALAALVSRLQAEDGLLVSGLAFSVGSEQAARHRGRAHAAGDPRLAAPRAGGRGRIRWYVVAARSHHHPAGRRRSSAADDADAGDGRRRRCAHQRRSRHHRARRFGVRRGHPRDDSLAGALTRGNRVTLRACAR